MGRKLHFDDANKIKDFILNQKDAWLSINGNPSHVSSDEKTKWLNIDLTKRAQHDNTYTMEFKLAKVYAESEYKPNKLPNGTVQLDLKTDFFDMKGKKTQTWWIVFSIKLPFYET